MNLQGRSGKFKLWGQSIIELLLAIALSAILLPALFGGLISSREGKAQQKERLAAISLVREAEEAVRSVRERDWNLIALNGPYHPFADPGTGEYSLLPGPENVNNFTRLIDIDDTFRDASGAIAQIGTVDPSTKEITVTVSWTSPYQSEVQSVLYLTRMINNNSYIDTTEEDFNRGIADKVTVTNDEGGEVVLGAGGVVSWCNPNLSIQAVDLPKNGVANAVSAIEGQVVSGTGENASGVSFAEVDISNPDKPAPPEGTINGTFDGYKTNGVFGENDYAYLATDSNFKEIVIIDLTQKDANGKFAEAGYFNAPGNLDGNSIYVSGNIGYATVFNKLYTFDLSQKSGSRPVLGEITLEGTGNKVIVRDNYAYVAVESLTKQLQIIDVSPDGTTLTESGYAQLNGAQGKDVYVNGSGTRAYMATSASATAREMFIVNIESKTGPRPTIGEYETNGMNPKGVTVVTGNRAILVGTGGEEYQVINIARETINPPMTQCGGLNIDSGINGVSSVLEADGDAYSYIITGDSTLELKIIAGGPGGEYSPTGTFESGIFDAGQSVAFNRLEFTADTPYGTTLNLQTAAAEAVSDSCDLATYTYVGPDGTAGSYFSTGGPISFASSGSFVNPGRCFRYKAYFTSSDILYSAVLKDVSVNFSP